MIGWMVGMAMIIAIILAMCSFAPNLECGEEIGAFNNVSAYYNDGYHSCSDRNWSEDGSYSYGMKWQCVEFVRRYYYEALNHKMPNRWGNAADYFRYNIPSGEMNTERNLTQYYNGDMKPKVNDILSGFVTDRLNRYYDTCSILNYICWRCMLSICEPIYYSFKTY